MADVPISDALIDSAQFQVQETEPDTPDSGNVRLFRDAQGWKGKLSDGSVEMVWGGLAVFKAEVTVTATQLKALTTVPKVIIPGVDDRVIVPFYVLGDQHNGDVAYASDPYSALLFGYETSPGVFVTITSQSNVNVEGKTDRDLFYGPMSATSVTFDDVVGKDVVLYNANSELVDGDGTVDLVMLFYLR